MELGNLFRRGNRKQGFGKMGKELNGLIRIIVVNIMMKIRQIKLIKLIKPIKAKNDCLN